MRYEIRFYDAPNAVKVTVELNAGDRHAAEDAAWRYLGELPPLVRYEYPLVLGVVKELS